MQELLMSFPEMEEYPSPESISITVLSLYFKDSKIGAYLMAIVTDGAKSIRKRASTALKTLSEEKIEGKVCGLLYIHSDAKVGEELSFFVKLAYEKIVNGIQNASYSENQLIDDLAELRWFKSHAMEFMRGSPSIAKWMEQALVIAHGFKLVRNKNWIDPVYDSRDLADLHALSMPLSDFKKSYREHTVLLKIQDEEL